MTRFRAFYIISSVGLYPSKRKSSRESSFGRRASAVPTNCTGAACSKRSRPDCTSERFRGKYVRQGPRKHRPGLFPDARRPVMEDVRDCTFARAPGEARSGVWSLQRRGRGQRPVSSTRPAGVERSHPITSIGSPTKGLQLLQEPAQNWVSTWPGSTEQRLFISAFIFNF